MDGSIALLVVLLVGFIALGLAAVAGGVDSREFDTRRRTHVHVSPKGNEHDVVLPAPARQGHHRRASSGRRTRIRLARRYDEAEREALPSRAGALHRPPSDRRHGPRLRRGGDPGRSSARRAPSPTRPAEPERRGCPTHAVRSGVAHRAVPFSCPASVRAVSGWCRGRPGGQPMRSAIACQSSVAARSRAASARAARSGAPGSGDVGDGRRHEPEPSPRAGAGPRIGRSVAGTTPGDGITTDGLGVREEHDRPAAGRHLDRTGDDAARGRRPPSRASTGSAGPSRRRPWRSDAGPTGPLVASSASYAPGDRSSQAAGCRQEPDHVAHREVQRGSSPARATRRRYVVRARRARSGRHAGAAGHRVPPNTADQRRRARAEDHRDVDAAGDREVRPGTGYASVASRATGAAERDARPRMDEMRRAGRDRPGLLDDAGAQVRTARARRRTVAGRRAPGPRS